MAFFDDVGKKIAQTSQGAAQKAKSMAEIVKLNGQISDEEKHISNAFYQIGKTYYENFGTEPDQLFAQLIAGINDSNTKIAIYSEQVSQLKGIVRCPNCGAEVPYGVLFCSSCGVQMNTAPAGAQATAPIDNTLYCVKCGAPITAGKAFCAKCGQKVEPSGAPVPISQPEAPAQTQYSAYTAPAETGKCTICGYDLPEGAAFCLNCGQKNVAQ